MRWTNDWRIYFIAAAIFLSAGAIAWVVDGFGLRPVFGLGMALGMALIGTKARREAGGTPPQS
jgi:hypothetical protein